MIPSIQHYLDAAARALQEVVAPAIDPQDSFAREQLALVQGMLAIIGQQWPLAYAMEAIELKELGMLAEALLARTGDIQNLDDARTKAQQSLNFIRENNIGDQAPSAALQAHNKALREAIETIIDAVHRDSPSALLTDVRRMVIEHAEREADRGRAWFAGTRIDIHWKELPRVESVIAEQSRP